VICYDIRNPAVDRVIKRDSADLLVLSQAELADLGTQIISALIT